MTLRRWLSREGAPVTRIPSRPAPCTCGCADEMPPRPPEGRQPMPAEDIWGIGAATVTAPDRRFDPCGSPPLAAARQNSSDEKGDQ